MYPLDPYHYFLEGVVTDVLDGLQVVCLKKELISVTLDPRFLNCAEYFSEFFNSATGYLTQPNSTDVCQYCPLKYVPPYPVYPPSNTYQYKQQWPRVLRITRMVIRSQMA